MATGVVATGRKHYTQVVKGISQFETDVGINFNFATIDVEGTGSIEPMGIPVVWNNTGAAFNVYVAQDISAVTGSPLPDGSPIALIVGAKEGKGFNKEDIALSATAVEFTALFRGHAAVSEEGIDWGTANAAAQTAFKLQLETQGIAVVDTATDADPAYLTV